MLNFVLFLFFVSLSLHSLQVLIEKLLYSCSELKQILVLVRPKKGKSPESRIEDMFKIPVSWKQIILITIHLFASDFSWIIFFSAFLSFFLSSCSAHWNFNSSKNLFLNENTIFWLVFVPVDMCNVIVHFVCINALKIIFNTQIHMRLCNIVVSHTYCRFDSFIPIHSVPFSQSVSRSCHWF